MKSIGLDCRSGIATAAVSLPIFLIGYCILLIFASSSAPMLFSVLLITAVVVTTILAVLQGVWTRKTYVRRLQKTTRALEELSLGKPPEQLYRERYVLCSDIKQCPRNHTMKDCLACELYFAQNDLEKLGAIVNTLGGNIESGPDSDIGLPGGRCSSVITLKAYERPAGDVGAPFRGVIRRDYGFRPPSPR